MYCRGGVSPPALLNLNSTFGGVDFIIYIVGGDVLDAPQNINFLIAFGGVTY